MELSTGRIRTSERQPVILDAGGFVDGQFVEVSNVLLVSSVDLVVLGIWICARRAPRTARPEQQDHQEPRRRARAGAQGHGKV